MTTVASPDPGTSSSEHAASVGSATTGNWVSPWLVVLVSPTVGVVAGTEVVVVVDELAELEVGVTSPVQAAVSSPITAIPAASALTGVRLPARAP
jgi:hypothetical protein